MNRRVRNIILPVVGAAVLFGACVGAVALVYSPPPQSTTVTAASSAASTPKPVASSVSSSAPSTADATTVAPTTAGALPVPGTNSILPTPAFGSLGSGMDDKLFNRVTVVQPQIWFEGDGDSASQVYADTTTCADANLSNCPQVTFLSLTGANGVNYKPDPITAWAKSICPEHSPSAVQGPARFSAGGETAGYYLLSCDGTDFHAWYVPSRQLLVMGRNGQYNPLEVSIVQAVMERIRWGS